MRDKHRSRFAAVPSDGRTSENTLRDAFDLYRETGATGASGGFTLWEAGSGYSAIVKSFIVKNSTAFRPESECSVLYLWDQKRTDSRPPTADLRCISQDFCARPAAGNSRRMD